MICLNSLNVRSKIWHDPFGFMNFLNSFPFRRLIYLREGTQYLPKMQSHYFKKSNMWVWRTSFIKFLLSVKHCVFSGPYFPVFGLNTGKYEPEKTSYFTQWIKLENIHKIINSSWAPKNTVPSILFKAFLLELLGLSLL